MKKTNRRPDGTEEVLEGDPEELRKYEDLQKPVTEEQAPITEAPKKPGILHGAEVDGQPLTDAEIELIRFTRKLKPIDLKPCKPIDQQDRLPRYPNPIWITYCSTCGRTTCQGECWGLFRPYPLITYTTTSGEIKMQEPERASLQIRLDGTSEMSHSLTDFLMGRATLEVKTNGN